MQKTHKANVGDKFFRLTVIAPYICEKQPKNRWLCKCDCGQKTVRSALQLNAKHKDMSCGKCRNDLTGKRYGSLVAIRRVGQDKKNNAIWEVQCDCGKSKDICAKNFKGGMTTSCGSCKFDLLTKRFGSLSVIEKLGSNVDSQIVWSAQCDCGRLTTAKTRDLISGHKKTCGKCYNDLTGKRFGRLLATEKTEELTADRNAIWLCKCDCGNDKNIAANSLTNGNTKSCGCLFTGYIESLRNKDKKKSVKSNNVYLKDGTSYRGIDLSEKVFGKLTVRYPVKHESGRNTLWMCSCSCGNEKIVETISLTTFSCCSCGCKKRRGHGGTYKSKISGVLESYDSHWELIRMKILDDDPGVINWTKLHKIKITYKDNNGTGKQRNYIPDFLIQYKEQTVLEEIKGFAFDNATVDSKSAAATAYCNDNNIIYRFIDKTSFCKLVKDTYGKTVRSVLKDFLMIGTKSDSAA